MRGLVQQIKSFERVAEAAVTGDYETALVAMTINFLSHLSKFGKANFR
ncbi:hypothetical protein ACEQPO_28600 [Bacillus sp. SL00103]